jgi:hypothetical protein
LVRVPDVPLLVIGRTYSWEDLGTAYGFDVGWLNRMGGMGSRPDHDAVLIITHPGGGKSFDYNDYWDRRNPRDLIYTGKGQTGDQRRVGENRFVGDNLRTLLVFEQAGSRTLRYIGAPRCVEEWQETALGKDDQPRRVIRFRLRFDEAPPRGRDPHADGDRTRAATDPQRRPRSFDPARPPRPRSPARRRRDPAEADALQEKASQGHHALLATLHAALLDAAWTEVGEIPAAIDLWGRAPNGRRVIFEAKTLRAGTELERVRAGIGQLLEYRFFHGAPEDRLCLVVDRPLSGKRIHLLDALDIAAVAIDETQMLTGTPVARELLGAVLDPEPATATAERR